MKTSNFLFLMKSTSVTLAAIENKYMSFEINGETPGDDDEPIVTQPPKK